jgi:single-stranded DNA-binding protein
MVEGRLTREEWDDKKSGEKKSATRIMIESFQFLKVRDEGTAPARQREVAPAAAPKPDLDADDLPF